MIGGVAVDSIAEWNGSSWSALGSDIQSTNGKPYTMVGFNDGSGDALYVGGAFKFMGGAVAPNIAKWSGTIWSPLTSEGRGLDRFEVPSMVEHEGDLYVAGEFEYAGNTQADGIAMWDGENWSALGSGLNNLPRSLASFDDGSGSKLHVGGLFTTAGGVSVNHIASWNGTVWSSLGSGMTNSVYALTGFDDGSGPELIAGGVFTTAGGVPSVNRIASWDGFSWSPLGSGLNSTVYALAVHDDGSGSRLYVGGPFTSVGGAPANRIAMWDGSSWSALGSGLNSTVYSLLVFDDGTGSALYAGGAFTTAGGVAANYIAKWDGSNWSPLGSGLTLRVRDLAVYDDGSGPGLYVLSADNTGAILSRWNGSSWATIESFDGSSKLGRSLAVYDDGAGPALFMGGDFTNLGNLASNRIAKYSCTCDCNQSIPQDEWALIALGCATSSSTVEDVFGDDLTPGDYGTTWIVIERDESTDSYYTLALTDTLSQGEGYWFKSLDSAPTLDVRGNPASTGCPASSAYNECFDVSLVGTGGGLPNMKGFPYSSAIPWADVRFVNASDTEYSPAQAQAAGIASKNMYLWNGNGYDSYDDETTGMEGTLEEFAGFWVKANQDLTLRMPTAAALASSSLLAESQTPTLKKLIGGASLDSEEWYIRLTVTGEGMEDHGNLFGRLADSVDGLDLHDLDEMAPFGDRYLTAVFPHPEWGTDAWSYASDYRQVRPGAGGRWDFEIRSDSARQVTLSWQGAGTKLSEILGNSRLVDEETQAEIDPSSQSSVTIIMAAGTHRLSWRVNAVPSVSVHAPVAVTVGQQLTLAASFTDEDPDNTHSAIVDWGDGVVSGAEVDEDAGTLAGKHTYQTTGLHDVEVCVVDEHDGDGCAQTQVSVMSYASSLIFSNGFEDGDTSEWSAGQ